MGRSKFNKCPCKEAETGCMYACPCHNTRMSGICYSCILKKDSIEFSEWMWANAREYFRGGTYSVSEVSGLDWSLTYTIEELYDFWSNNAKR